ncbi:MAG TPA: hypothetical protein VHF26_05525, partial [Trebonia sp.]|nr:hypothetical protein [Trebonia sp.]
RTAWDLQAVLPGIGALLADGTLTYAKARAVDDALSLLSDEDAVRAEAMIVPQLPGKTYGQVEKLAVQAAITVDPESEIRRRQDAERNRARIALRRDPSGAASLAGYDLPADETLAAHASVCARAAQYKESGVFAGVRMDQLRALAYLDILNGITAEARIVSGQPPVGLGAPNDDGNPESGPGNDGSDSGPGGGAPDGGAPGGTDPGGTDPDGGDPGGGTSGGGPGDRPDDEGSTDPEAPRGSGPAHAGLGARGSSPAALPPRLADLVIPLTTLLGLAERPGEGHGFGPLDPGLCRALAATAANSPHTTLCVTVTNPDGVAIGHGCARGARHGRRPARAGPVHTSRALAALPARVNLTMRPPVSPGSPGPNSPEPRSGRLETQGCAVREMPCHGFSLPPAMRGRPTATAAGCSPCPMAGS